MFDYNRSENGDIIRVFSFQQMLVFKWMSPHESNIKRQIHVMHSKNKPKNDISRSSFDSGSKLKVFQRLKELFLNESQSHSRKNRKST